MFFSRSLSHLTLPEYFDSIDLWAFHNTLVGLRVATLHTKKYTIVKCLKKRMLIPFLCLSIAVSSLSLVTEVASACLFIVSIYLALNRISCLPILFNAKLVILYLNFYMQDQCFFFIYPLFFYYSIACLYICIYIFVITICFALMPGISFIIILPIIQKKF